MSINRVVVSGNLTREPEVRTTASGQSVLNFGIAVNDRIREGDTWKDRASFIDCTWFGNRAASVAQYIAKGSHVTISGKLRQSKWERDGQTKTKIEIIIDDMDFQSGKGVEKPKPKADDELFDEDVPF